MGSVIGPVAAYAALKAVVIASKYLQDLNPGRSLAVIPEKHEISSDDRADTMGMLLHCRIVAEPGVVEQPEIFVAADTNTGLMAGLMTNILKEKDHVTIGGMGANSVSNSLKATLIAHKYMQESMGDNEVLALVPSFNQFEENDEERMRMILSCCRTER